jgi:hypothetical protein
MAAFANLSEYANRVTGGNSGTPQFRHLTRDPWVNGAAAQAAQNGRYISLWEYQGTPGNGVPPTTVAIPDNTTPGTFHVTSPGGGRELWLLHIFGQSRAPGQLIPYDRLLHIGSLDGDSTGTQTVGGSITRHTSGVGNEIWLEIYTAVGATARAISATYTNQAGTGSRTTPPTNIGGTGLLEAQRIIPLPLQSGDQGVQACADVAIAAAGTGTTGNFGVNIVHPFSPMDFANSQVGNPQCFLAYGGPYLIESGACIAFAWLSGSTTLPYITAKAVLVER